MTISLKELLLDAKKLNKAIFCININDMIDIKAVANSALQLSIPIIFNISNNAIRHSNIDKLVSILQIEKKKSPLPFYIQLDHAKNTDLIVQCIKLGFDIVMVDSNNSSYSDNVSYIKKIKSLCKNYNIIIEAQIGEMIDTRDDESLMKLTSPSDAQNFVSDSGADCLSISFGNEHNYYLEDRPVKLQYNIPSEIHCRLTHTPLVIHGADTISSNDLKKCVDSGITKINIGPCIRRKYTQLLKNTNKYNSKYDHRMIFEFICEELTSYISYKIRKLDTVIYKVT